MNSINLIKYISLYTWRKIFSVNLINNSIINNSLEMHFHFNLKFFALRFFCVAICEKKRLKPLKMAKQNSFSKAYTIASFNRLLTLTYLR